jgi:Icc-related predicted phosphoesterase
MERNKLFETASSIRILLLSDTHNTNPSIPSALASTDLILHAGDLTNTGTPAEIQKQLTWLRKLSNCSCERCLSTVSSKDSNTHKHTRPLFFIGGNHDLCLDAEWYKVHGAKAHNQLSSRDAKASDIRAEVQTKGCRVRYVENSLESISSDKNGHEYTLSIFGTPMSPILRGSESRWSAFTHGNETSLKTTHQADDILSLIPLQTSIISSHSPPLGFLDLDRHGNHTGCPLLWKHIQRVKPKLVVCGHRHEGRGCIKIVWSRLGTIKEAWKWIDPAQGGSKQLSLVSVNQASQWEQVDVRVIHQQISDLGHSTNESEPRFDSNHAGSGVNSQAESNSTLIINASIMATSYQKGPKSFNKPIFVDLIIPTMPNALPQS